ncbi:MAG: SsrA-binding protein SmpB [Kiritimatiellae bacterium]|nr:SsrA-binding protein SmpB [Kiritimatiellia bacterium]
MTASPKDEGRAAAKIVATHRKAFRDYHILEKFEAGIELRGTEVKSVRGGHVSLNESFGRIENGQVFLHKLRIEPYSHGGSFNHDPLRSKRLLLHRREIDRLFGQVNVKGQTLIPLRVLLVRGLVKVELAVCRGKHLQDKREALRRKTADREAERAMSAAQKRKR